ncbi:MAG: endonuclease VIII [Christensenellales bacterium]|jgi:formamidopyrimidine-DNA glycosylase
MLEIPESHTVAGQLKQTVAGKTIARVQAAKSPHRFAWYNGETEHYPDMLCGRQITDAYALCGQVVMAAEDMRVAISDGVNVRFYEAGEKLPEKHQLYVGFEDGTGLCCTVQMYGGMMAFQEGGYDNPYYLAALQKAPYSPLEEAFDRAYFDEIVEEAGPKSSVKALLATQQRIPGLGNGCLQDILWSAKVNPQSKTGALDETELDALFKSVKSTIADMTQRGGRNTEKDLFGHPGGYRCILSSGTLWHPCPRCGGSITRKVYMGGNIYFCPACQPVKK